ncbi:MAG: ArsR family transcriptional regulator [Methanoregula sp.]|nr:ArsR family transcriptional regulator [Methanoregula sp.]
MSGRKVQVFTEKEESFVKLLIGIGIPRTVSKVLVYLANTPEATSRDIERGADLRQPEVSIALQYLKERDWIVTRLEKTESIGRPQNVVRLSRPIDEIADAIRVDKENEINQKLTLARRLREYI